MINYEFYDANHFNKKCEACGVELKPENWPYSYRSIGNLCPVCKEKARRSLNISDINNLPKEVKHES